MRIGVNNLTWVYVMPAINACEVELWRDCTVNQKRRHTGTGNKLDKKVIVDIIRQVIFRVIQ